MKQIYYTSCRPGQSVSGHSGFHVRAVSRDVSPNQLNMALRYAGYSLPDGTTPTESTAASAPVRLALLDTPDAGRVLCHSVYVGKDPHTGRFGNFFSHLLLDVPEDVDLPRAIATWENPFWEKSDPGGGTELPDVTTLPKGNPFQPRDLQLFLRTAKNRETLLFVLDALLTGESYRFRQSMKKKGGGKPK